MAGWGHTCAALLGVSLREGTQLDARVTNMAPLGNLRKQNGQRVGGYMEMSPDDIRNGKNQF